MRLIDADALIADLETDVAIDQDTLDYEDLTEINRINIQFDKDCKKNAIDLLKNAPTIEPRKKGHWIRHPEQRNIFNGKTIECSECHEKYTVQYVEDELFCRHCGADMGDKG